MVFERLFIIWPTAVSLPNCLEILRRSKLPMERKGNSFAVAGVQWETVNPLDRFEIKEQLDSCYQKVVVKYLDILKKLSSKPNENCIRSLRLFNEE